MGPTFQAMKLPRLREIERERERERERNRGTEKLKKHSRGGVLYTD
jgi:hypothetical protein